MTLSQAFLANNGFKTAAEDFRNLVAAIFRGGQGVSFPTDFALTPGSGLSVNYAPGYANITGTALATQGAYFVWDTSGGNITWPAANPSNPRIDALVLFVCDSQYGTTTSPDGAQWVIIEGTAAASPSAPSNTTISASMTGPGGWLRVANVEVAANATSISSGNISKTAYPAGTARQVQTVVNPGSITVLTSSQEEIFRFYIPANSLAVGQSISYRVVGQISGNSTSNWPYSALYLNGSSNITQVIQPSSWPATGGNECAWVIDGSITCTATGSSGGILADIRQVNGANANSGVSASTFTNCTTSSYTMDTTSNQYLSVMMAGAIGSFVSWNVYNGFASKVW